MESPAASPLGLTLPTEGVFARIAHDVSSTVLAGRSGISVACIRGRSNAVRTEGMTRGGEYMAKKLLAAVMALSFLTVMFAGSADAKRRCPRGQEDVGDVCVPK